MSRIRANTITNQNANGAPNFPDGITVTGVVTATTTSQNITGTLSVSGDTTLNNVVGAAATFTGVLTYEDVTNVDSIGVITARDGLRVTGIATATEYEVVNSGNTPIFRFRGSSNNEIGKIDADAISGTTSQLRLYTENGGNIGEKLRIGPAGQIGLGGANYGTAGQALLSGGASSAVSWGTIAQKIVQVKQVYYSNTPVSFSNQGATSLGTNNVHFPVGARFGGTFTKISSTSKILVFGKMSYAMANTNVHGVVVWVVGDESNFVNLMDDSRSHGTYGSGYAHMHTPLPGIFFNTAYNAGSVTVYCAPAFHGGRNSTGILNANPHSNSVQGNADTPNKDAHSMMTVVEIEFT